MPECIASGLSSCPLNRSVILDTTLWISRAARIARTGSSSLNTRDSKKGEHLITNDPVNVTLVSDNDTDDLLEHQVHHFTNIFGVQPFWQRVE
jgi:hypothetical protein